MRLHIDDEMVNSVLKLAQGVVMSLLTGETARAAQALIESIHRAHEDLDAEDRDEIIKAAREQYGGDDVMIDDDATFSRTDNGTWVMAWMFVNCGKQEDNDGEEEDDETEGG